MVKDLICISCPLGCHLKVDIENNIVSGNNCKRGEVYGLNEVKNPLRVITTTVKVRGAHLPVVPVKTNEPIPKELNFKAMEIINNIEVEAPIKIGQVLIKNILGTGIDVVASRTMVKIDAV